MKKIKQRLSVLVFIALVNSSTYLFAAGGTTVSEDLKSNLFRPIEQFTEIATVSGSVLLTLCLVAQGLVAFFGDNMSETIKKTVSRVATGGCLIGGAAALAGFIL